MNSDQDWHCSKPGGSPGEPTMVEVSESVGSDGRGMTTSMVSDLMCAVSRCSIFSECKSHPATGSLQPVAIEATRGGNETVGAFETDGSLWRLGEPTGRNRQ